MLFCVLLHAFTAVCPSWMTNIVAPPSFSFLCLLYSLILHLHSLTPSYASHSDTLFLYTFSVDWKHIPHVRQYILALGSQWYLIHWPNLELLYISHGIMMTSAPPRSVSYSYPFWCLSIFTILIIICNSLVLIYPESRPNIHMINCIKM